MTKPTSTTVPTLVNPAELSKTPPKSWRKSSEEIEAMEIRVLDEAFSKAGLKT